MNKYLLSTLGLLVVAPGLTGCDSMDNSAHEEILVVEAFLYAGEPVEDIRITRAVSLTSEDTVATPVNGALVRLVKEGVTYSLSPVGLEGHYAYQRENLSVTAGDEFELIVEADGQTARAVTIVPSPPVNVALSAQELEVPSFGIGRPQGVDNYLTVTWDNPDATLHYVVIESTGTGEPTYILPDFIRERIGRFRLVTRPTDANYYDINWRNLEEIGPHEVRVYRVNDEYADLYENRQQDSRDLNEPPTNIRGGLGVFSAFNSRNLEFDVVRSSE
ncbi:MAG: DUF4249 family protein [Bacteroidota bacterium]|nr:DUF4249 family protein [Bacteroidota bacterium]